MRRPSALGVHRVAQRRNPMARERLTTNHCAGDMWRLEAPPSTIYFRTEANGSVCVLLSGDARGRGSKN